MDRIKRLSMEVLNQHKAKFGVDFTDNKTALDQISVIRSKGLKNEIAGYITKFIKRELREKEEKAKRMIKQTEDATPVDVEPETTKEVETVAEEATQDDEKPSETTE